MKLAHLAIVTPGRCGLYETTRELVAGLRALGIDSRIVDPKRETNTLHPAAAEDRGAPLADMAWALTADVLVNHSGYDNTPLQDSGQPVVHVAHGRPRSSFLSETSGSTPIYSYHYAKNRDPRFKAVVTFWPEHEPYLRVMFPDKTVHVVTAPVDLAAWSPEGPAGYRFGGKRGGINLVSTDAWRDDVDPFLTINAAALFARKNPGTKLHVYARPATRTKGWDALLRRLADDGSLGEVKPWVAGLANVYRAADAMVTPNTIATRSVRESMACGCPVAVVREPEDGAIALALSLRRDWVRREAARLFDPGRMAAEFKAAVQMAVSGRRLAAA